MATVVKVVSGNNTTFTVTDVLGNAATLVVATGAVTGNTITYGGAAVANDATQMIFNLLGQLQTGLMPGLGAQGITN